MTTRAKVLMFIMLAVLAMGGFYLRELARRLFLEIPQHGEEVARTRLSETALQPVAGPPQTVKLYFPSYDQGLLLAEDRQMAWATREADRIRQILLALIAGSYQGKSRALPPATNIRAVFLTSAGTAYIDFSSELLADFSPGIASECLAVYSIVNSLAANIPAVKKVKILVQGQEVETLDGHADLSDYFVPDPSRISRGP